jgi:hypothetical protein
MRAIQPLDNCIFGLSRRYFKQTAAAWMKQNPQSKITQYQRASLIEFAWKKLLQSVLMYLLLSRRIYIL